MAKRRKILFALYILLGILTHPISIKKDIPFTERRSYTNPEAKSLISQLLKNTYRAFDFREEGDVYDKLSISIDDELLPKIYLQTRKSMLIENQGGIQARVSEVILTNVAEETISEEGLAYRCKWMVRGTVGHWGHDHQRANKYDAIVKVKPVNGAWKIFDLEIIDESRL